MKRRNFLKGFLAATGTLAVAPAVALAPVEHYGPSEVWPMMQGLIDQQMYCNRLTMLMDYIIARESMGIRITSPKLPDDYFEMNGLGIMQDSKLKLNHE